MATVARDPASPQLPAIVPAASLDVAALWKDPAIRYGLKFGIAGVTAVFIALVIRLDMPGWALLTVFVLMSAQYVGAIAEKSIYRFAGTVVGGVAGYLLVGSLEQDPLVFIPLIGLVVAASTAMFGQSRYPYAFFLCGMTTLVVASNGMKDPANSWMFMTSRIQEVFIGILVVLVVQSVIWPRYARVEFIDNLHAAFGDLRTCFLDALCRTGEAQPGAVRAQDFPARITGLRTLLEFGARESQHFRVRLDIYYGLTACLGKIAYAIGTLRERLPDDSLYRKHAGKEIDAVHAALAGALEDLEGSGSSPASRQAARAELESSFHGIDGAFLGMRTRHLVKDVPASEAMTIGLHVLALDEMRAQILEAHALLESLHARSDGTEKSPRSFAPPLPPRFWVRTGIKSGLAMVVALAIDNWLHPPGGPMFVLGAWLFTALNAASPGGQGDRRAFHLIPLSVAGLAALSLLLAATSPMLSSYAVMNTLIFCFLFVWGFLSFRTRGMTIPMQASMLILVGILGLNGQRPVDFQAISGLFFGLVLGLTLSSLFQRLLWPSLPQWEIRDRLLEVVGICRSLLAREPLPLWTRARLALIPSEVAARLPHLSPPICPNDEIPRLSALMRTLVRIGGNLALTLDRIQIPPPEAADGKLLLADLERKLALGLANLQLGIGGTSADPLDETPLRQAVQALHSWMAETRLEMIARDCPPIESARLAGFCERYALLAADLLEAHQTFSRLRLPLYMGDYSL